MPPLISDTGDIMDMVVEFLEGRGDLGLNFVGAYDEKRIPSYPAVVVVPGARGKEIHSTSDFQVSQELFIYVYHADLTLTKRERSRADMKLVANIEEALEEDSGWRIDPLDANTRQLIFSYISETEAGLLQPRANKSNIVICTKMTWRGLTQRRLK